jgi:hypothetical protein
VERFSRKEIWPLGKSPHHREQCGRTAAETNKYSNWQQGDGKSKRVSDGVELVSNFAHQSTLERYSQEDDEGRYEGILENIRSTSIFQQLVYKLPGSVHRLSPESLSGLLIWNYAALRLQGSYSGESATADQK